MANPTSKVASTRKPYTNTRNKWFFVGGATNAKTYQNGQMVGSPIDGASKAGYVTDFDDSQALYFLGLLDMPSAFAIVLTTTADGTIEAFIDLPQWINMPLHSGTASRATDIGKPVYAFDAGSVTLNGAATTYQNLVGYVVDIDSGAGYPAALTGPNVWIAPTAYGGGGTIYSPSLKTIPISLDTLKESVVPAVSLPAAATSAILGLIAGTYLTSEPTVQGDDSKTVSHNCVGRRFYVVPPSYVAGSAINLIANAGMTTTVADTSCFLLVECVRAAAPTVNIGPVHQSINSLVAANKTFAITPTNVVPGDILDFRFTTQVVDGASGTAVIPTINALSIQLTY